ncbi:MAG TPA: hypothetical protein VGD91_23720 [Trebonia sp.]
MTRSRMTRAAVPAALAGHRARRGPTLASTWLAAAGNPISDTLLQWPATCSG